VAPSYNITQGEKSWIRMQIHSKSNQLFLIPRLSPSKNSMTVIGIFSKSGWQTNQPRKTQNAMQKHNILGGRNNGMLRIGKTTQRQQVNNS